MKKRMKNILSVLLVYLFLVGLVLSFACCSKRPSYDTTTFNGVESTLLWEGCKVTYMENAELARLQEAQGSAYGLVYRESFVRGMYGTTPDRKTSNVSCIETANEDDAVLLYQSVMENTSYYVLRRGCLVTYSDCEYVIQWLS